MKRNKGKYFSSAHTVTKRYTQQEATAHHANLFNNINRISSEEEIQANMEFMEAIELDIWGW
eukprot:8522952-Ditylum_brightwellii.AAC.1